MQLTKLMATLTLPLAMTTLSCSLDISQIQPANASDLKVLIPLYSYPDPNLAKSGWDDIASTALNNNIEIIAIINPMNGPGKTIDPNYSKGIQQLKASNVKVLGYVSTKFNQSTPRSLTAIKTDINTYKNFYSNLDGIFFDEISNTNNSNLWDNYSELYNYANLQFPNSIIVGNPGTQLPDDYFAWETTTQKKGADIWVVTEIQVSKWADISLNETQKNQRDRFSVLLHSAPVGNVEIMEQAIALGVERGIKYMFVTDDELTPQHLNPWDSLPTYWQEEAKYIEQLNSRTVSEFNSPLGLILFGSLAAKSFKK